MAHPTAPTTWRTAPPPDPEAGEDAASFLPELVIDMPPGPPGATGAPGAASLVAANAAGRQAWGLGDCAGPVVLDRAMPALARLVPAARSRDDETLTFWTARGLLQLRCRVQAIAAAPGRFLVRGLADGGAVPRPTSDPAATGSTGEPRLRNDPPTPDLARLAHEVRTPLSAAIAYAEILKEEHLGPLGNARYREYARHIHDSAHLALSVVDGMLAPMLAGEHAGTGLPELAFRDLDPADVIDNCVAVARPLAERAGLDLTASYGPRPPRVIADEVSLKQMLLNLITNAIKFARPGDRVTLGATYGDDGCLRLEVADTGPGMSGMPGMDAPALPPRLTAAAEDAAASVPASASACPSPAPSPRPTAPR